MITAGSNAWQAAHGRSLKLDGRGRIMAIVNATPDSFSDGGRYLAVDSAFSHALTCVEEGADIIDIGGESTRPGAAAVTEAEEQDRVLPVIEKAAPRDGCADFRRYLPRFDGEAGDQRGRKYRQ